jgi:hypothetical protein
MFAGSKSKKVDSGYRILLDRPAQVEARVEFRKPVRRRAREGNVLGLSDKLLGIAVEESVVVKLVAAALDDDVEDAVGSVVVTQSRMWLVSGPEELPTDGSRSRPEASRMPERATVGAIV